MKDSEVLALRALSIAGKDIRLAIKRKAGSPENAEDMIREAAEDPERLERWCELMDTPIRFAELPGAMRDAALLSTAAAFLAFGFGRDATWRSPSDASKDRAEGDMDAEEEF